MNDELDHILVEQLHSTKKSLKVLKRHHKLMPDDPWIKKGLILIENKIKFFENMVENKELIRKKKKKKKEKNSDILAKNPVYEWYRTMFFTTSFAYKMFMNSISQYTSYFRKGK